MASQWDDFDFDKKSAAKAPSSPPSAPKQAPATKSQWDDFNFADSPKQVTPTAKSDENPAAKPSSFSSKFVNAVVSANDMATGAKKGASLGWSDEAAGLNNALGNGKGGMLPDVSGMAKQAGRYISGEDSFTDKYKQGRDAQRVKEETAKQRNPASFTTGEFATSAAPMMVPGVNMMTAPRLAALGAARGLGESEAPTVGGDIANAVGGAATNVALGKAAGLVGSGIAKVAQAATKVPLVGALTSKVPAKNDLTKMFLESSSPIEEQAMAQAAGRSAAAGDKAAEMSEERLREIIKNLGHTSGTVIGGQLGGGVGALAGGSAGRALGTALSSVPGIPTAARAIGNGVEAVSNKMSPNLEKRLYDSSNLGQNVQGNVVQGLRGQVPDALKDQVSQDQWSNLARILGGQYGQQNPQIGQTVGGGIGAVGGIGADAIGSVGSELGGMGRNLLNSEPEKTAAQREIEMQTSVKAREAEKNKRDTNE